jgi:hypothetical protein
MGPHLGFLCGANLDAQRLPAEQQLDHPQLPGSAVQPCPGPLQGSAEQGWKIKKPRIFSGLGYKIEL